MFVGLYMFLHSCLDYACKLLKEDAVSWLDRGFKCVVVLGLPIAIAHQPVHNNQEPFELELSSNSWYILSRSYRPSVHWGLVCSACPNAFSMQAWNVSEMSRTICIHAASTYFLEYIYVYICIYGPKVGLSSANRLAIWQRQPVCINKQPQV
jgi:hypothetical protein